MISIVVCTYNRAKFIRYCLDSLKKQTSPKSDFELVFVDNNSTDDTIRIYEDFLRENPELNCRYFLELKQGLSYARNRGIAEAKGEIIAFLDDDAIADPNYIAGLQKDFAKSPFGAGGGEIRPKWESAKPRWMGKFLMPLVSVINLGRQQIEFPGNKYPIGANMFFKRSVLDDCGDFNTDLGRVGKNLMGGEEKDIFARVKKAGVRIGYFPSIAVQHIIPDDRTTPGFIRKQALGIGSSEYTRTRKPMAAYGKRLAVELFKWGATLFISLYYLATLNWAKAVMLVKFRWWVTTGLINLNKE